MSARSIARSRKPSSSIWLERRLSKSQILKLYLDRAYMGGGTFGVAAASEYYFGKSVKDISLAEAAMLAGLFKAPTKYGPYVNLPAARARANDVSPTWSMRLHDGRPGAGGTAESGAISTWRRARCGSGRRWWSGQRARSCSARPSPGPGGAMVGIPQAIIPVLQSTCRSSSRMSREPWCSRVSMGGPLRRGNFNRMSAWPYAARSVGAEGLHFHDLRHTGNTFAAASGARLRDLMARMGHDSERAAMIYQHEARGADQAITNAID